MIEKNFWSLFFKVAGSSILISMACLDPGNLEGNMDLSYNLRYKSIWVLFLSHFILYFYQDCVIRFSTILNKDLPNVIKLLYPKYVFVPLWVSTEWALIAADIQGILGASTSLFELFGVNKLLAVILVIVVAVLILYLQEFGQKFFEFIFLSMLLLLGFTFAILFFKFDIKYGDMANGFIPSFKNVDYYSIMAILGATIVPQNLYLQSGLILSRKDEKVKKRTKLTIFRLETFMIILVSFIINVIICSTFSMSDNLLDLEKAGLFFKSNLNNFARILYFLGLFSSGLSSATSGAYCGQIILNGFLDLNISRQKRNLITRTITVIPCLLVIYFLDFNKILNFLNLVQFIQLPFAIIPIIKILRNHDLMKNEKISNSILFLIVFFTFLLQVFVIKGFLEIIYESNLGLQIAYILFLIIYYFCVSFMIFYNQKKIHDENEILLDANIIN